MATIKPQALLSSNNTKTVKGEKLGYMTYILYLSPFKDNSKGKNLCAKASKGCAESCLFGSGRGGMFAMVGDARRKRTEFLLSDRKAFLEQIHTEIGKYVKRHKDKATVTIRLNGTSDLPWEGYKVFDNNTKNIFEMYPDVQFYDYTKVWTRFDKPLPKNYHLTFSRSEDNHNKAIEMLNRGVNVAMVFDKLPKTFEGFEVINADKDDLRFLDARGTKGVVCGLKYKLMTAKGSDNTKAFTSGFAIKTPEGTELLPIDKVEKVKKVKKDLVV